MLFMGEEMTCIMCGKQTKSHPRIKSNWTALEVDGKLFYFCPDELPGKHGTEEQFKEAYFKIFRKIYEMFGVDVSDSGLFSG